VEYWIWALSMQMIGDVRVLGQILRKIEYLAISISSKKIQYHKINSSYPIKLNGLINNMTQCFISQ